MIEFRRILQTAAPQFKLGLYRKVNTTAQCLVLLADDSSDRKFSGFMRHSCYIQEKWNFQQGKNININLKVGRMGLSFGSVLSAPVRQLREMRQLRT